MSSIGKKLGNIFAIAFVSISITIALWSALAFLGAFTGILGMCSTAPEWWTLIWFCLLFASPFIAVVVSNLMINKLGGKENNGSKEEQVFTGQEN